MTYCDLESFKGQEQQLIEKAIAAISKAYSISGLPIYLYHLAYYICMQLKYDEAKACFERFLIAQGSFKPSKVQELVISSYGHNVDAAIKDANQKIVYLSQKTDSTTDGKAELMYLDGTTYAGEIKDGKRNGQGTYTSPDGFKHVGEFRGGLPNGRGTAMWPDGRKYFGEFKDGELSGQGTYTWPDGVKYIGEVRNGKMHGQGTMTYPDGKIQKGSWKNDIFAG